MNWMNRSLFEKHVMGGEVPVLVAFCASWCGYCRRLIPILKRLADRRRGEILVGVMDNDTEPELFRQEQIEVLPTLVLYRKGRAIGSIVSPESGARIDGFLDEVMEKTIIT